MRRLLGMAIVLLPELAPASPWLLRPGDLVVVGRYDFETATEEFLDDGGAQAFPLDGRMSASTYELGVRFGPFKDIELELKVPIKQVSYTSDPVILLDDGGATPAIDFYQENVIDLSTSSVGLGDLTFATRYQLFFGRFAGALEVGVKTPTGYDPPEGTFGDRPTSQEQFLADVGRFVQPGNVRDDVTLGDGQLDLNAGLLLGWSMSSGTFTRLDTHYRVRFGGAGDQVAGGFRVGQLLWGRLLLFIGADAEFTVTEGDVIGISVAAQDPDLPATEYGGLANLELRELRLERDRVSAPVGAIVRLTETVELNAAWSRVWWGRNTAASQVFSLGVGVRTNVAE